MWRVIWFKNPWKTNFCSISNRLLTGLNSIPTEEKKVNCLFFNLWTGSRLLRVRRPQMQKANGNAFCPQFSPRLAEMRLLFAGYSSTRIPARGLFFPIDPMQEVCLWKDVLVGKEVTPRHRIAWRLTRNWVSCLSSRQLWAKPFPPHHQFRPVHFFFLKYCQLSEHLSEDIVCFYTELLHIFTVYCTVFHFSEWHPSKMSLLFTDLSWVTGQKKLPAKDPDHKISLVEKMKITTAFFVIKAVTLASAGFDVFLCQGFTKFDM